MARSLALLVIAGLTACTGAPLGDGAHLVRGQGTSIPVVDRDPCGLPSHPPNGARVEIEPLPFDVSSIRVAQRPSSKPFPIGSTYGGPEATDLTIHTLQAAFRPAYEPRSVELVPKSRFGKVEMAEAGRFECNADAKPGHVVSLQYTTLIPHAGESAELVVGDAYVDQGSCKTTLVRRQSILASPIAGGILYAIREAPSADAPPDRLTFFLPTPIRISSEGAEAEVVEEIGGMTRFSVPLRRGTGISIVATFDTAALDSWLSGGADVDVAAAHRAYGTSEISIGVEITQAVGDPDPLGLAYIEKSNATRTFARTRLFQCPEAGTEKAVTAGEATRSAK